jgi:hypothetical protein
MLLLASSCGDTSLTRTLPNVTGSTGEVMVVMDRALWDGTAGAAVREYLGANLIGMPQPEPAFRLMPVNPDGFRDVYVAHRNVIIVKTDNEKSGTEVTFSRNRWAETQLVIDVTAPDTVALADAFRDNGEIIRRKINDAERERLTTWLTRSAGKERSRLTTDNGSWELLLPAGYKPDFNRWGVMMISAETPTTTQSVIVSVSDRRMSRMDCFELADLTEKVMSAEVSGPDPGSFMIIEKRAQTSCRSFRRDSTDYIEMRGLWTLEGGFMGGPFISYAFIDKESSRPVVVTGFVYAPGDDKRELLRQVEALMYTLEKKP